MLGTVRGDSVISGSGVNSLKSFKSGSLILKSPGLMVEFYPGSAAQHTHIEEPVLIQEYDDDDEEMYNFFESETNRDSFYLTTVENVKISIVKQF